MHRDNRHTTLGRLRQALLPREAGGRSDGELLECFLTRRDETAFSALVQRHGAMVLGVCRRLLGHPQDAEDAFQATFLVLVRRAAAIRQRDSVGNWLYGVAYRTSLEARSEAARRRAHERQLVNLPERTVPPAECGADLWPVLDAELSRLPDCYRTAVVLCDLEGRSRRDAARQLNVPEGTLSSRLATGRRLLAQRLSRRGIALSAGALAAGLSFQTMARAIPAPLMQSILAAAQASVFGCTAGPGVTSIHVLALAEKVVKAMRVARIKLAASVLLAVALVAVGGGVLWTGENARQTGASIQKAPEGNAAVVPIAKAERDAGAEAEVKLPQDVWTLDLRVREPRMLGFKLPDGGERVVWYLWYDLVNRTGAAHTAVPEFQLVISGETTAYRDLVLSGALERIREIEDPTKKGSVKDSVTLAAEPIPAAAPGQEAQPVTGVATWDKVSPRVDRFTIFVGGLSNAWSVADPDAHGKPVFRRKTLQLDFERKEGKMVLAGPPQWVYRNAELPGNDKAKKGEPAGRERGKGEVEVLPSRPDTGSDFSMPPGKEAREQEAGAVRHAPQVCKTLERLEGELAELEQERRAWKAERVRLVDHVRELTHLAEQLPQFEQAEARATLTREIKELFGKITEGDGVETVRKSALQNCIQQLGAAERVLLDNRGKVPGAQSDARQRQSEIEKASEEIAQVEQRRQSWQKEREKLERMIKEWKQAVAEAPAGERPEKQQARADLLKDLQRRLASGDKEDEVRQVDLDFLKRRLKALQEASDPEPAERAARQLPNSLGTVKEVADNLVIVSLGEDQAARKGQRLMIYRVEPKPVYVGEVEVVAVQARQAVGRLTKLVPGQNAKVGDQVASEPKENGRPDNGLPGDAGRDRD